MLSKISSTEFHQNLFISSGVVSYVRTDRRSDFNTRSTRLREPQEYWFGAAFFGITFVNRGHQSNTSEAESGTHRQQSDGISPLSSLEYKFG
jgi:hypothetical protein